MFPLLIDVWGCQLDEIPYGLFSKTPELREINWKHNRCPENGNLKFPKNMLDGTKIIKFIYEQQDSEQK